MHSRCFFSTPLLFFLTLFMPVGSLAQEGDFEVPLIVQAKDVVPDDLLKSEIYEIENDVITRGYTNTYRIKSKYGEIVAHGNQMLERRIQELRAIHELDKTRSSDDFQQWVESGARLPFQFMLNLITHPADTISGVPEGMWHYGASIREAGPESAGYDNNFSKELILFSAHKRKLAYDLSVDVYSSNKVLQEYLNSVSWATYSGRLKISIALPPVRALRITKTARDINILIRDNSPEDLRKLNQKILLDLNVEEDIIKEFLDHPRYSPRHETTIAHVLQYLGLKSGINEYFQLITTADSEEDAFFFQNIAELILHYAANTVESALSIVIKDNFGLLRVRKHFVFPLLVDSGYWSEFGARLINTFESEIRAEYGQDVQILLWITGTVSERAKKELAARNILLVEKAYTTVGKDT